MSKFLAGFIVRLATFVAIPVIVVVLFLPMLLFGMDRTMAPAIDHWMDLVDNYE